MRFNNLVLFCLVFTAFVNAQTSDLLLRKNYNLLTFEAFADSVESEVPVHLFFDKKWVKDITIEQSSSPIKLEEVLEKTLIKHDLDFFIEANGNILLTKKYKITTKIPESVFSRQGEIAGPKTETKSAAYLDFFEEEAKPNGIKTQNGKIVLGNPAARSKENKASVSGTISSSTTGGAVVGAVVYIEDLGKGTVTDAYGYYVIELPRGKHQLVIKSIGYEDNHQIIELNENGILNLELAEEILRMRDVVITAQKEHNVSGLAMGLEKLEISTIKQLPSSMGEADILKSALMLPGVQTVGEAASGFNVRGGSTDQNLVLIDQSPIFNTSHLFGFFSVFNPDVVNSFKLYKSGIPASYGGRISSVFDVVTKNGNRKKVAGSGGISPLAGRLCIELPIVKDKASLLVSGRSTYSDYLLKKLNKPELKNSEGSFYDANAKFTYDINANNSIVASLYTSEDYFKLNSDTTYNYRNINGNLSWKHSYSKKLYANFSLIYSNYTYNIISQKNPYSAFEINYLIDYKEFRVDFTHFLRNNHTLKYGANGIYYKLNPCSLAPLGALSIINKNIQDEQYGIEPAVYFSDEIEVSPRLSVNAGIRYSMFYALGPSKVYKYAANAPRTEENRIDSNRYKKGDITKYYGGPEIRLSARYKTGATTSVKASYNRIYQYIVMLSNTVAVSPTDMWRLCDANIPPQRNDQYALGVYKNFANNTIETSLEMYYKHTKNMVEYKGGAELILNKDLELSMLSGIGEAYGAELMLKKNYGRLNGWVSYTYSRSLIKVDSKFLEEKINGGDFYPANYDKPHDFTLVSNYKYSRRFSISNSIKYSTGRPITYPVAKFEYKNAILSYYSNRNEYRVPDYFRWDFSINLEGNLKSHKLSHSSWSLSIYNVTGRKNVYSVFFKNDAEGIPRAYKMSIFARPIITLTYNFKF